MPMRTAVARKSLMKTLACIKHWICVASHSIKTVIPRMYAAGMSFLISDIALIFKLISSPIKTRLTFYNQGLKKSKPVGCVRTQKTKHYCFKNLR